MARTRSRKTDDGGSSAPEGERGRAAPGAGFTAPPADGGLSIDRLARAFASMMGVADPYAPTSQQESGATIAEVDPSPDLDEAPVAAAPETPCRVSPETILEALLFVGLPGGEALDSRRVAGLMRGVRPQEIDDIAIELGRRYRANRCPYEVVSLGRGWVMRLRPEYAAFGRIVETRTRQVRLDAESLEVLAVVAWNQPVPRDRLVELGCDASPSVLRGLVRRGLLALETGSDGTPRYRTTRRFLDLFSLARLEDLPPPDAPPG